MLDRAGALAGAIEHLSIADPLVGGWDLPQRLPAHRDGHLHDRPQPRPARARLPNRSQQLPPPPPPRSGWQNALRARESGPRAVPLSADREAAVARLPLEK